MAAVGLMSAVMNNVGATAVLLPAVVSVARRLCINPSRPLMPLAFGSLLGGMTTLIGTPSNILVSDALRMAGLEPFSLFDFAPVGLAAMVAGIAYMLLVGQRCGDHIEGRPASQSRHPLRRVADPAPGLALALRHSPFQICIFCRDRVYWQRVSTRVP